MQKIHISEELRQQLRHIVANRSGTPEQNAASFTAAAGAVEKLAQQREAFPVCRLAALRKS